MKKYTQYFRKTIFGKFLIYGLAVGAGVIFFNLFLFNEHKQIESLAVAALFAILALFFYQIKLQISVDKAGIKVNFWPFAAEYHSAQNIASISATSYPFISMGMRYVVGVGLVYRLQGRNFICIKYHSGEQFLVGVASGQIAAEIKQVFFVDRTD